MRCYLLAVSILLSDCAPAEALADCVKVSAEEHEVPTFPGLHEALADAANFPSTSLCLVHSQTPFVVKAEVKVQTQVTIYGNRQTINFLKMLEVRDTLSIFNATLTSSLISEEFSIFSLLEGSLRIQNSLVNIFNATLIKGSGPLIFISSSFSHNNAPVVYLSGVGEMSLRMQQCEVWNHTGEFLLISPLINSGSIFISIQQTIFRQNQGPGFLLHCSIPFIPGNFTASESQFINNNISQLYFDIGDAQVSFINCAFINNSQTTVTVYAAGSVMDISDSEWSGNSQIAFDFRQFTGDFFATRITVADQRWKGVFQQRNSLSSDLCRFTIQDSSFLDTYFKVNETTPGVINLKGCLAQINNTVIDNVRIAVWRQRDVEGLVILQFGSLLISNLTLRSSGTAGLGIGVAMGNFTIRDSSLHDVQAGAGLYTFAWVGRIEVYNVNVSHGSEFPLDEVNQGTIAMYFSALYSVMKIRNVDVQPSKWEGRSNSMFTVDSTVDIAGVKIYDHRYESAGYFQETTGSISNITISNCVLDLSAFFVSTYKLLHVSDVSISNSVVGFLLNHGIFAGTPRMNLECTNLHINNVSANYLLASKQAQAHLYNVSITDSKFNYFLKNQLDSNITLEKMNVRRSTAVLAFLYRSSLHIIDSVFQDLESNSIIFGGENVNLTLERVTIQNTTSPSGFGRFREKSHLTIFQSTLSNYKSDADEGFYQDTGSLSITDSSFFSFNTVFVQTKNCSVFIRNSVFQEGRSKARSQTSASAYGGALACADCSSVVVENSSFFNVSAIFGGAIAVRSSSNLDFSSVFIRNCEFVMCSAVDGGAVHVKESSLDIEKSKFIGNEATSAGGAIEISNSKEHSAIIRHCELYRNKAHEGGAVKWDDAEVLFVNSTFQDNAAFYGPNIASFGIKLFGSIASSESSEAVASGYPLQLVFELQDHYAQRVFTASMQDFQLSESDQVSFLGNTVATIEYGIFNFSQLTIYSKPNSTQKVSGTMVTSQNGQVVSINAFVDITFRDCVPGEVRKADRCEYCFAGNFSFHPSDQSCSFCLYHAFCPGGNVLLVDPGYWRNNTNSTDIAKCPLKENCLGGQYSECAEGYTRKVCNECSEDYTRHRTLDCEPCRNPVVEWVKVGLTVVPVAGFTAAVKTASDMQLFVLKQILNHAQMLSALSYLRVTYPTVIKNFLHSMSYLSSLFVSDLPIACFSTNQPEYIKAIIGSILPPVIVLSSILFHHKDMKKTWILCTSWMMFTPMISLTSQVPLLVCQPVLSEEEYLFVDMQEKCWEGRHLLLIRALMLPSAILNVILPIALVSVTSIIAPQKFDDLFPLWKSGVKLRSWDLLTYCAKVLVISVFVVSIAIEQLCQVAYAFVVLIFVSVWIAGASNYAYVHWKWFFLVEHSLVIVAVSAGLCAYFIYHSPTEGTTDWLVTGLFVALNVGYFGACVRLWVNSPDLSNDREHFFCGVSAPPNSLVDSLSIAQRIPACAGHSIAPGSSFT